MTKVKEVIITAIVTSVIAGIGYLIQDYHHLKEAEKIRIENSIKDSLIKELDSLYSLEVEMRKESRELIFSLFDSASNVNNENKKLTKKAIEIIEDNDFSISTIERDSLRDVLRAFSLRNRANIR